MDAMIRRATLEDFPAVAALCHESDTFHAAGAPDIFLGPAEPLLTREVYEGWLADPQKAIFVAERVGRVVGLAISSIRDARSGPAYVPARVAYLHELIVFPGQRQAGVGKLLLAEVERWSREQGVAALEFNVFEFPGNALAFYERLGYTTRSRSMRKQL